MLEVSVVIPSKDALAWLPAALESIGSGQNLEIVVVDDGSTDGTDEFIARRALLDTRIRVVPGPGMGPSAARNVALGVARAPLIAFLDADDRWRPGKIETQAILHRKRPDVGFSFTDYSHHTVEGEDRGGCFTYWPRFHAGLQGATGPFVMDDHAMSKIYAENIVGTSTVVARTDLLREVGGFDTSMGSAEDWDLWLRLASRAPVGCIPWIAADYLMHRPGNVSGQAGRRASAMRHFAKRHEPAVRALDHEALRCCEARILTAEAEAAALSGRRLKAIKLRAMAWSLRPTVRNARELASETAQLAGYRVGQRGKSTRSFLPV